PSAQGFGGGAGAGGFPGGFPGGFGGFGGFGGGGSGHPFEDLFRGFAGGGGAGPSGFGAESQYGRDVNVSTRITFMEAVKGTEKSISYQSVVNCDECSGSGVKKGHKKSSCGTCGGTGQQTFIRGGFHMSTTCSTCGGSGVHIPRNAMCKPCDGQGRVMTVKSATVNIPAGVDHGMKVRVARKGDSPMDPSAQGFGGGAGAGGFPGGFPGGFGGFDGGGSGHPFEDLFRGFAGGSGAGPSGFGAESQYGRDVNVSTRITFMEAVKGTEKSISYQSVVNCDECSGSGVKKGHKKSTCGTCGGTGQQMFIRGGFHMSTTCSTCGGSGVHIPRSAVCKPCDGQGRVMTIKSATVNIPAGVDHGMKVRVARKGDSPMGGDGVAGDLYVHLEVTPHPKFHRDGSDIFVTASVPLHMAVLGGSIHVPTIDGDAVLKIAPGTQPEERKRLQKRGVVKVAGRGGGNGDRGDQYVTIKIAIPRQITESQRAAFMKAFGLETESASSKEEELSASASKEYDSSEPKAGGIFDKIKQGLGMKGAKEDKP
ncbi:UNVERIFIED_CONTAM: hypothetical protein HDU68_004359, partial [Siphonaria sp. JEL0065]